MSAGGLSVAVVGGGIFGVTAAVRLARAGHRVVLWESAGDVLLGASRTNQRRMHRGYHYPRSPRTAAAAMRGLTSFVQQYPSAVVTGQRHYVAVAGEGSRTTAEEYMDFCDAMGLEYTDEYPPVVRRGAVQRCLRVREWAIDLDALRAACWRDITRSGVRVLLNTRADRVNTAGFDQVVVATYANLNDFRHGPQPQPFQFEVCEKPLVRLPAAYRRTSVVVLDGPFTCFDPIPGTDTFLLGSVVHAIHSTTIGPLPLVPARLRDRLDRGLCAPAADSKFAAFVADGSRFFVDFAAAEHLGSLFTIRAVLPGRDRTDERPTWVHRIDHRTVGVFSGKIATCVDAAEQIARLLGEPDRVPDPVGAESS